MLGISLISGLIKTYIGYKAVGFIFQLIVIVVGMFGSIGAVILAACLSTLIWDYFFIPPTMTFAINTVEDFLMCISFFTVAMITGFLTNRIRYHEKVIREREERTNVLYEVLKDIANAHEKTDFIMKVTSRTGALLDADCGVILKSNQGKLEFEKAKDFSLRLTEKDEAVAQWCFESKKNAGWSTDTLASSRALFLPLFGSSETVGVFAFQSRRKARRLDSERESLLFSIVSQLGLSVERHFLTKRLAEAQRLKDSEELHQTLLNSISHEMRTPLTAILGAAEALDQIELTGGNKYVKDIAFGLHESGERLNRVIENLLDMSRLNSGVLSLKFEWHDINDLLSVVIKKLEKILIHHQLKINFLDEVYLAKIDYRLMEHAISNILLNAAIYTPSNTLIKINLKKTHTLFVIEIEDEGFGIPDESIAKIFDKFYRVPGSPTGGTGLGLSIVKSIVELHRGHVSVQNIVPLGACFKVELPIEVQPSKPAEGSHER